MKILTIGSDTNLQECQTKFGEQHQHSFYNNQESGKEHFAEVDVVFDFTIANFPQQMKAYRDHPKTIAFLNTTLKSLNQLCAEADYKLSSTLFGFCGLPTFLNRPVLEVSSHKDSDKKMLVELGKQLNTDFVEVDDKVGLVTPRVICMIINEAYYTVQDGTATREDIDLAMKLGTNYPYGPFEWAKKIGIKNVYEVLEAVYLDTKDERYKICPVLKQEYLFHRN